MLLSGSRDKTLIIWNLTRDETNYGYPKRSLHGHSHIVSDCVISSDGAYALSASWDKTLRLWELATGATTRRFVGHTNDVLSVSFSRRQPPDCIRVPRSDHQAVEHTGRLQVYHHRQGSHGMGQLCEIQPKPTKPRYCVCWMGQTRQGT